MASPRIAIDREAIAEFCRRNHIRRLSLFGSVLRGDFDDDSDIDVLVEFEPDHRIGLIEFVRLEDRLGLLLGRKVDLATPRGISKYIRTRVLSESEVLYPAA